MVEVDPPPLLYDEAALDVPPADTLLVFPLLELPLLSDELPPLDPLPLLPLLELPVPLPLFEVEPEPPLLLPPALPARLCIRVVINGTNIRYWV